MIKDGRCPSGRLRNKGAWKSRHKWWWAPAGNGKAKCSALRGVASAMSSTRCAASAECWGRLLAMWHLQHWAAIRYELLPPLWKIDLACEHCALHELSHREPAGRPCLVYPRQSVGDVQPYPCEVNHPMLQSEIRVLSA